MIDFQLLALLLTPLTGGLLLAVFGSRNWAAELNSLMSFCTFICALISCDSRLLRFSPDLVTDS